MPSLWERIPGLCRILLRLPPAAAEVSHRHRCRSDRYGTGRLSKQDLPKQSGGWMRLDVAGKEGKGSTGSGVTITYQATPGTSQFQPFRSDFNNLIEPFIRRNIKAILLRNCRRDKPNAEVQQRQQKRKRLGKGWKLLPTPDSGGPVSISQDEGASIEVTGTSVSAMAWMTAGNGSRTSPEKLKPGAV